MAGKRFFEDFDSDRDNSTEKRMKSTPSFASVVGEVVMVNSFKNLCSALEPLFRKVVNEEIERGLKQKLRSSFRIEAPEATPTLKLIFGKKLSQPIFTSSKITDVDNNPLEILLVETSSESLVPVNLNRLIKLDIVAVHGDFPSGDKWTSEEFESNIVRERDGKRPLLAGEVTVTVRNGVGTVGEIEFTDNSSWIRSRKFRIGAKVARGSTFRDVRVREAMTEAFVVRDHRGELYKKHHPPMLEDDVWRLEKIGKDGAFHKKLSAEGVHTVQDFLKLSVVDPARLKRMLGPGMSEKMWEVTLKHARECVMGNKFYIFRGPNFFLVLNPICQVMKAVIDGHIFPTRDMTTMNRAYLESLVRQAYTNWTSLEEVEGTMNEPALLTQGDTMGQQHGVNHYHNNADVGRPNQQTGFGSENWEIVNAGYVTTPVEFGFRFSITGSSSEDDLSSF